MGRLTAHVTDLDSEEVVEVIAIGPSPNYIVTTGDGQTFDA